jgi:hypothetical protein
MFESYHSMLPSASRMKPNWLREGTKTRSSDSGASWMLESDLGEPRSSMFTTAVRTLLPSKLEILKPPGPKEP